MFCTFSLQNVLFATAACNFWCLLSAPSSAPAALTSLLLDWPDTRIIEKTQHFATSLTFRAYVSSFFQLSDYCIFCPLTWLLYCWAMHVLFNSPYCRKFLFKLPSTTYTWLQMVRPPQPTHRGGGREHYVYVVSLFAYTIKMIYLPCLDTYIHTYKQTINQYKQKVLIHKSIQTFSYTYTWLQMVRPPPTHPQGGGREHYVYM